MMTEVEQAIETLRIQGSIQGMGVNSSGVSIPLRVPTGPTAQRVDGVYQLIGLDSNNAPVLLKLNNDGTFVGSPAALGYTNLGQAPYSAVAGTDITKTLQRAHDDLPAAGGIIFIPNGSYTISSTVNFTKPVILRGSGINTTILAATRANYNMIVSTTSLAVEDLTASRPVAAVNVDWQAFRVDNTASSNLAIAFERLLITGFDLGIYVEGKSGSNFNIRSADFQDVTVVVNASRVQASGDQGTIFCNDVDNVRISDCNFIQTGTDSANNLYLIGCQQSQISNCNVTAGNGIKVVTFNRPCVTLNITNNRFLTCAIDVLLQQQQGNPFYNVSIENNDSSGNLFVDTNTGCIYINSAGTSGTAYELVSIEGNTFRNAQGRCVMFGIASGQTLATAILTQNKYSNFSVSSTGVYPAVDTGSTGTLNVLASAQEIVDGGTNGLFYFSGARFLQQSFRDVLEINCTSPSTGIVEITRSLKNNLAGFWPMDTLGIDVSGAGHTLTNSGSVVTATGLLGNAASIGAGDALSMLDSPDISMGSGVRMTATCWVKLVDKSTDRYLMLQDGNAPQHAWALYYKQAVDRFELDVSADGTNTAAVVKADNFGSPSTGVWYFVVARYDGAHISISVNGGAANTTVFSSDIHDSPDTLRFGFTDGLLDEVGLWKRALSDTEIAYLYNNGHPKSFPWV
jgi:hypothetical protein